MQQLCNQCDYHSNHKLRFTDYVFTHTAYCERPYAGEICDKRFVQKSQLKNHTKKVHVCLSCGEQLPDERTRQSHKISCKPVFECFICHKIQDNKTRLRAHMKIHRNDNQMPISCEDCYRHHKTCCCKTKKKQIY